MTDTPIIGIDLGTTYSVICRVDEHGDVQVIPNSLGQNITPSVVFFQSENQYVVGRPARDAKVDHPDRVVEFIKRSMGLSGEGRYTFFGQTYSPEMISALILKKLKADAEAVIGQEITHAVITCPAYFNPSRRDATKKAAQIAGLTTLQILNEPTAASVAFGFSGERHGTVLVFDFGGGTFDVTILRFLPDNVIDVLVSSGHHELGGKNLDDALLAHIIQQCQSDTGIDISGDLETLAEVRAQVLEAKHTLSEMDVAKVRFYPSGQKYNLEITPQTFEGLISGSIQQLKLITKGALKDAKLTPEQIDDVLLVGGSTRVPAVRAMVQDLFGKAPNFSVHPDEAVGIGAALTAAKLMIPSDDERTTAIPIINEKNLKVTDELRQTAYLVPYVRDIVPHSLGTTAVRQDKTTHFNSIILKRGEKLPASSEEEYYTVSNGQRSVHIDVNEGEVETLDKVLVTQIGEFVYDFDSPKPENYPVRIKIGLDLSGIIVVTVTEPQTGKVIVREFDYTSTISSQQAEILRTSLMSARIS